MNNDIKAFIFDMDGVIVDTIQQHCWSWQVLADREGWEFDAEINKQLLGLKRRDSLRKILEHNRINLPEARQLDLCEEKNRLFHEKMLEMTESDLLPGIRDFIMDLKRRGYKLAVASASRNARPLLEITGIAKEFYCIVDGSMVKNGKPAPDAFLLAAEMLNVRPEHCVVVEDAAAGIEAAHNASMRVIGVGSPDDLPGADCYIRHGNINLEQTLDELRCV